jgi:non-canonical (house-cleaning) NTP pyrophosphatase
MGEMLATKNSTKLAAVTAAFLKMKKFDVGKLQVVYDAAE